MTPRAVHAGLPGLLLVLSLGPVLTSAARAAGPTLSPEAVRILTYHPQRLSAALKSLVLGSPDLARRRWRAVGIIVLLRMARVYVVHHERGARPDGAVPEGFEGDMGQALGALEPDLLLDTALEVGEMGAAFAIGRTTRTILERRYPPAGLGRSMALKFWSYAPVFIAWSVSNQVYGMMKRGEWPSRIDAATVAELARRVGGELAGLLVFTLAVKALSRPVLGLLGRGVARAAQAMGINATAAGVGAGIVAFASRAIRVASIVGWVLLAVELTVPHLARGLEAAARRELRDTAGQSIAWLDQLDAAIRHHIGRGEAQPERLVSDLEILRWLHTYAPVPGGHRPLYKSKREHFLDLARANNTEVELRVRRVREHYLEALEAVARTPPDTAAAARAEEKAKVINGEVPGLFVSRRAGPLSLSGMPALGEISVIDVELGRLASSRREEGNRVVLAGAPAQHLQVVTAVARRFYGSPRGQPFLGGTGTAAERLDDFMGNLRADVESEVAGLKEFLEARREQVRSIETHLPTLEDVRAEKALLDMGIVAVRDLAGGDASGGRDATPPPGFDGLEGRR